MNIKSFKKIVIILSLLIGGSNIILSSDFNQSTFLFCLKSDIQPLAISKSNNELLVNNIGIQNLGPIGLVSAITINKLFN